jgi:hypothetical protein
MIELSGSTRRTAVAAWSRALAGVDGAAGSDAERIDAIRELEELKAAAAAAQARITAAFDASQRAAAAPRTREDQARLSRSISAQVGLARRQSPARGQQHLGVALALVHELPHTLAALTAGTISEFRAMLVVKETAYLTREDRRTADRELAGRLAGAGDRRVGDLAREVSQRLDPGAAVRRARKAAGDRRVTLRPAPDTMSNLGALLPVAHGVAVRTALRRQAEAKRAQGDPRSVAQLMADILVARATGQSDDEPHTPDVAIDMVVPERTLFRGSHEPARIPGFGPIPSFLARQLVRSADKAWIRRLYTAPETGELVAMDSRSRFFPRRLRRLVVLRDQVCRTPGCEAPIRHADHVRSAARGGATSAVNAQGLCEACNYLKESPAWRADVVSTSPHVVEIRTPTGHLYESHAPPQPGADPPATLEQRARRLGEDVA